MLVFFTDTEDRFDDSIFFHFLARAFISDFNFDIEEVYLYTYQD